MIEIVVNGTTRSVPQNLNLDGLLSYLEVDASRVAVERNGTIARKPDWGATPIVSGDRLEIVWFVGGGCN